MSNASNIIVNQVADSAVKALDVYAPQLSPEQKMVVADIIVHNAASTISNQVNDEPWYKSRVTWGAIITVATGIMGALGIATDWIDTQELTQLGLTVGTVVGGVITLYGRWKAKKPIGE